MKGRLRHEPESQPKIDELEAHILVLGKAYAEALRVPKETFQGYLQKAVDSERVRFAQADANMKKLAQEEGLKTAPQAEDVTNPAGQLDNPKLFSTPYIPKAKRKPGGNP